MPPSGRSAVRPAMATAAGGTVGSRERARRAAFCQCRDFLRESRQLGLGSRARMAAAILGFCLKSRTDRVTFSIGTSPARSIGPREYPERDRRSAPNPSERDDEPSACRSLATARATTMSHARLIRKRPSSGRAVHAKRAGASSPA